MATTTKGLYSRGIGGYGEQTYGLYARGLAAGPLAGDQVEDMFRGGEAFVDTAFVDTYLKPENDKYPVKSYN